MPRGVDQSAEQKLRMLDKTPLGSSMASLRKCSSTLPVLVATPQTPLTERRNIILQRKKRTPAGRMKKFLKDRIQILNWIGDYNMEWGISDFIAGVTLGLTIIPESIACALLAGLPARYGLCSAFIGSFLYLIFGSINKVIIGPTSLVALVSVQFTVGRPIEFAFLLTFFSGCVEMVMGVLQMGFIFDFISMPAIKAFSSATAILVIESQLKVLLGIKYVAANMLESLAKLSENINDFNAGDLIMGFSAIAFLVLFEQLERLSKHPKLGKPLSIIARYSSYARNTLIVLITAIVTIVWLQSSDTVPYALSKNAHTGLPNVTLPEFTIVTPERTYSFWDIVKELNLGIIVIPIIGLLTNISIGKLEPKGLVNTNQELLTVGLCNVFGACVQSMPTSGAFSRYAISTACNLKTPMANLYSGIIALLALSFLSPYFKYIPEPTLAAILICSIYTLLDFRLPLKMWRQSKRDFGTWIFCFIVSLLRGVEVGLFFSIIINALHLLYLWARPDITVKIDECDEVQYISITPGNGIYFPAISHLRETVAKACQQADYSVPVVINCNKVTGIDFTAAQGFSKLSADLCRHSDGDASSAALLILYQMDQNCQKLIALSDNLVFCDDPEKLREFLKQESMRNGFTKVKDHVRASIDLGYKIESA